MAAGITRRAFLAATAALPAIHVAGRQVPEAAPEAADVVVIGGDPAALAAVFRLAETPGIRVLFLDDAPAWAPVTPAPATIADLPPFVRGHQVCFNGWRDRGNAGWGYADVLPSFMRLEKYEAGASAHRGGAGPVPVAHCWDPHPGHRAFLLACNSGGFAQDSRHDFNGPRSQSVGGYYQKAIADDKPVNLEAALVEPARSRGAVAVVPRAQVTRIVCEGRRAGGVEYLRGGERAVVRATRAVILGASPVRAAQLLHVVGRRSGPAASAARPDRGGRPPRRRREPSRSDAAAAAMARAAGGRGAAGIERHGRALHRVARGVSTRPADGFRRPAKGRRAAASASTSPSCSPSRAVGSRCNR